MKNAGWIIIVGVGATIFFGFKFADRYIIYIREYLIVPIFEKFEDDNFPLLLAAVIILVAIVLLAYFFFFVILPKRISLMKLTRFINTFSDKADFSENFNKIAENLQKNKLIGHAWIEFRETLVESQEGIKPIQNTARPQTFINFNCAQEQSPAIRLMPHVPNYFVGIGLLLTFVGLVAALNFATTTVETANANEAVGGLKKLLVAATFKFWTSIAGLISSIVLSFFFRLCYFFLDDAFSQFCSSIEQKLVFATPQRIFFDVRDTINEQLSETKKINTDIAMSIGENVGDQIKENLPGMLIESVKPLVDAVQNSSDKVRENAAANLENLVKEFASTLEGSTSQHLDQMSATLHQLTQSLNAMQGSMDFSGSEFSRRMAEGSERLDETMRELSQSIQKLIEEFSAQVGEAGQTFGTKLEESLERLTQESESLSRNLVQQSHDAAHTFANEITEAGRVLAQSVVENAESGVLFAQEIRNSLGENIGQLQSALSHVNNSLKTLDGKLEEHGRGMSVISERARDVAGSLANVSNSINEGLEPFLRVSRNLNETSVRLEQSVFSMAEQIQHVAANVETVSQDLSQISQSLQNAWESYQIRFESVDQDLERAFNNLLNAVRNHQQSVQSFVTGLDNSFKTALDRLTGGIEGIGVAAEEIADALRNDSDSRTLT